MLCFLHGHQFFAEVSKGLFYLFLAFFAGTLYTINIFGKQAFVYAHTSGYLGNVQLWKLTKNFGDFVVEVWLVVVEKTTDMNVFIYFVPTDGVAKTIYFKCGAL